MDYGKGKGKALGLGVGVGVGIGGMVIKLGRSEFRQWIRRREDLLRCQLPHQCKCPFVSSTASGTTCCRQGADLTVVSPSGRLIEVIANDRLGRKGRRLIAEKSW